MLLMVEEFVELCYLDVDLIIANYYLINFNINLSNSTLR